MRHHLFDGLEGTLSPIGLLAFAVHGKPFFGAEVRSVVLLISLHFATQLLHHGTHFRRVVITVLQLRVGRLSFAANAEVAVRNGVGRRPIEKALQRQQARLILQVGDPFQQFEFEGLEVHVVRGLLQK